MVAAKTTSDLVEQVREQTLLPTVEGRLGSTEALANLAICRFASDVLRTRCADLAVTSRTGRWLTTASNVTIVAGTSLYAVPERALASGAADILITDGTYEWSAPEIPLAEAWRYRTGHGGWDSPYAYCWRDDDIELLPHPTAGTYYIRFIYPRGILRLVRTSDCAVVASTTASSITTAATVPSAWTSTETLDVIRFRPNGQPRIIDLAGTTIGGTSITIAAANVPSTVVAGDFVCLDGETCVPPVTEVVWPVLVAGTSFEVLASGIGNAEEISIAAARLQAAEKRATELLTPRSRGASKKIVAWGSPLRRGC